jgi:FlaA1/EpsC-like NDP-sugar epimerase
VASNSLPTFNSNLRSLDSDLRSSSVTQLRRGFAIKWLRVAFLVISDTVAITLAWWLASLLGTPMDSPWHVANGSTLLPLILAVMLGIISSRGLYKSGDRRRDYLALFKAVSLAEILLFLIAFLYEPDRAISRSTFLLSWFLTVAFTSAGRFGLDYSTHTLRKRGAACYPVFLISEPENRDRHSHLIRQESYYNIVEIADASALDRANRQKTFALPLLAFSAGGHYPADFANRLGVFLSAIGVSNVG